MKHPGLTLASLAACLWTGCSPGQLTAGPPPAPGLSPPPGAPGATPPAAGTLYDRLGGGPGISAAVTDFVGRVLKDPKINGYFLNAKVDGNKLGQCLIIQLTAVTGGPATYPSMGCRDMKTTHLGMKVSMQDFTDLAGHLVETLQAGRVAQADIDAVVKALLGLVPDIVEDPNNNLTVYQRVGRKPAIVAVVDAFTAKVVGDARINGFFGKADAARLKTCLVRQVCNIDGPCQYGGEVDNAEPGVSKATPCREMVAVHSGMTNPPGAQGGKPLTIQDFGALVEDLMAVLDTTQVTAADKGAVYGALGRLCPSIVAGGIGCM